MATYTAISSITIIINHTMNGHSTDEMDMRTASTPTSAPRPGPPIENVEKAPLPSQPTKPVNQQAESIQPSSQPANQPSTG